MLGGHPLGAVTFVAEELQGEVNAFYLAGPSFGFGPDASLQQVCFEFVQAWQHGRVDGEHGAADDLILAPGSHVRHFGGKAAAAVRTLDELGLIIPLAD